MGGREKGTAMSARVLRSAISVVMSAALAVAATGCGSDKPEASKPDRTTTSASRATPASTTPTTAPSSTKGVVAYFLHAGTASQTGPFLVPVWRGDGTSTAEGAVRALLAGPPAADEPMATPALSSAVPTGTRLLDVAVSHSVATVDLSAEFQSGGGSTAMLGRLAQLVYTLTRLPDVERVALKLDGKPVTTFSGEGVELGASVGRSFFDGSGLLPRLMVDAPAWGEPVRSPFVLAGLAKDVAGASFPYELTAGGESVLGKGAVTTGGETGWSSFRTLVTRAEPERVRRDLVVYVGDAAKGRTDNVLQRPFVIEPGAGPACSAAMLPADVADQSALPAATADMRRALARAAVACDYAQLGRLADQNGKSVRLTFGEPVDPATYFKDEEAAGHPVLWRLRKVLEFAAQLDQPPGAPISAAAYIWPSAAVGVSTKYDQTLTDSGFYTADELKAMRQAFGGGYAGWRVFVNGSGDWQLFVTGD